MREDPLWAISQGGAHVSGRIPCGRCVRYERYQADRISAKCEKTEKYLQRRKMNKNKNLKGETMLQAGEKRELTVVKETNFGVYLAEEEHSKDKVLLPKKEAETIK